MTEHISIPDARTQLHRWAQEWNKPELADLARQMVRRRPKHPTAKATRQSLTPQLAERIRQHKALFPEKSNRAIGETFGVDGGRVSEAIHKTKGF